MVQLQLDPSHQRLIRCVLLRYLQANSKEQKKIPQNILEDDTISHKDLYEVVRLLPPEELPSFRSLVAHSTWKLPAPKAPYDNYQRSTLLDERLGELRERLERKRYRELTQDLSNFAPDEPSFSATFRSFREQLILGLQVITSMITGFIVGYYIAWKLTENQTTALICGLLSFIFAMFVDVVLIITGLVAKDMSISRTTESQKNK